MKTAIITGASSGMGKWFAIFATYYYPEIEEIWLIGRKISRLSAVAKKIDVSTKCIAADITEENDVDYIQSLLRKHKPDVKLLVNSAGLGIMGHFRGMTRKEIDEMITTNCKALTDITYLCLPYMSRNSRLINMASAAAFTAVSNFAVYSASKSYVLAFSDGLGRELRKKKIYVTAVCPGFVNTPFMKNAKKYGVRKPVEEFFMTNEKFVVHRALWDSRWKCKRSIYGFPMKMYYLLCKFVPTTIMTKFV